MRRLGMLLRLGDDIAVVTAFDDGATRALDDLCDSCHFGASLFLLAACQTSEATLAMDWRRIGDRLLRFYIIGRVMVEGPDGVLEASGLPGRQGRLALVYLCAQPRRVDRAELADVLWSGRGSKQTEGER